MEARPAELTRSDFVGQPPSAKLSKDKLETVVVGQSKKTGRRL